MSKIKRYIEEQMEMGIDLLCQNHCDEDYEQYTYPNYTAPYPDNGVYDIHDEDGWVGQVDDLSLAFYTVDNLKKENGGNYTIYHKPFFTRVKP